ncbi:MAG TPA: hypothetical protein VL137_02245 [Polyangiaceae bacterium]|nr:hypothetical protein [Polyangiaceae bacterium]
MSLNAMRVARYFVFASALSLMATSNAAAGDEWQGLSDGQVKQATGRSYSQLQADWWTWVLAQPAAVNPVLDPTGALCAQGQEANGNAFFLVGSFSADPILRDQCVVSSDKTLVIPALNSAYFAFPEEIAGLSKTQAEKYVRSNVIGNAGADVVVTVNGQEVKYIRHRESELFGPLFLTADSIFGEFELALNADEGFYVALQLEPGDYMIGIHASQGGVVAQDVTYQLHVVAAH